MPRVVIDGEGSWGTAGYYFKSGATECDDPAVLEAAEAGPEYVYVEWDENAPLVKTPNTEPEPGPMLTDDLPSTEYICRADGCGRSFPTSRGRATHERIKHPTL